ncbi:MAG: prepilin peptidase [Candidatus Spechtbacterales bacterium]
MTALILVSGVFGLLVGSFLNMVIYRLHTGESMTLARSHCTRCKRTLAWYELVPIASFFTLGTRCRTCKRPIAWGYPLVEAITAGLFMVATWRALVLIPDATSLVFWAYLSLVLAILSGLIVIFVYDLQHYIIPDKVLAPITAAAAALTVLWAGHIFGVSLEAAVLIGEHIAAAVAAFVFFFSLYYLSDGRWMGLGDVKLVVFIGLFVGLPEVATALFVAFVSGAIIGVVLIVAKRKRLKSRIPFGPFLVVASMLAFWWGEQMFDWYFFQLFSISA